MVDIGQPYADLVVKRARWCACREVAIWCAISLGAGEPIWQSGISAVLSHYSEYEST